MLAVLLAISAAIACVSGHGRVLDPPSRASMWRYGYDVPSNYDDDGLNCGGFSHQHMDNDGKCGICGDPYDQPSPRDHEIGGTYGQGIITGIYQSGDVFTATVQITAYHKGFWEFKLCPDPYNNDQECFDENPLELEEGGTKYYPLDNSATYKVNYRIPTGFSCEHCVLQWRYTAGNNWGVCGNGTSGLGCGNQEQFGACSDIEIKSSKDNIIPDESLSKPDEKETEIKVEDYITSPLHLLCQSYLQSQQGLLQLLWKRLTRPQPYKTHMKKSKHYKKGAKKKPTKRKSFKRKKVRWR